MTLKTTNVPSIHGAKLYVDPSQIESKPIEAIAEKPLSTWIGGWTTKLKQTVDSQVADASNQNALATFVLYNLPHRDCGGYSSGGVESETSYKSWIDEIVSGINKRQAIVVLEPDALAQISCLDSKSQSQRYSLLRYAVSEFAEKTNAFVYIDAGHSDWISSSEMASRLMKADVQNATGFSLNVSNFQTTDANTNYGNQISSKTNGKHFVIDTSRNGAGSNGEWCNPSGRKLGNAPTTNLSGNVDAYLWVKTPGESDGTCNGGPSAGTWWQSYAEDLTS